MGSASQTRTKLNLCRCLESKVNEGLFYFNKSGFYKSLACLFENKSLEVNSLPVNDRPLKGTLK